MLGVLLPAVDEEEGMRGVMRFLVLERPRPDQPQLEPDGPLSPGAGAPVAGALQEVHSDRCELPPTADPALGTGEQGVQRRLPKQDEADGSEQGALAEAVVAVEDDPLVGSFASGAQVEF